MRIVTAGLVGSVILGGPTMAGQPKLESRLPDPPGDLHVIDGHAMHLSCTGEGRPTVVLDAGLGDAAINLRPLQDEVATFTRVCSFDRPGYGWSEPGPAPRTSARIIAELEALLAAAGERGPFVLAGHSFGGINMILMAATNPDATAGVVLIDSSHPDQIEALAVVPELRAMGEESKAELADQAAAAEAGEFTAADALELAPDLPDDLRQVWAELYAEPHSMRSVLAEWDAVAESLAQAAANGSLGDIPLVVLAHGRGISEILPPEAMEKHNLTPDVLDKFEEIWRSLQEDHLTRSTNSSLMVAEEGSHYIYRDEPDLVIDAIYKLVTAERNRGPGAPMTVLHSSTSATSSPQ